MARGSGCRPTSLVRTILNSRGWGHIGWGKEVMFIAGLVPVSGTAPMSLSGGPWEESDSQEQACYV